MNFFKLAWKNANGNTFRSLTVFTCAALVAGFAVAATIIIGGAQRSLRLALERLGADIIAVSAGSERLMENAFLMGVPARTWMPADTIDRIATLPEVQAVSPQFFLSTLRGATCCSVPEMFLIAYDPQTDFTLKPWLESHQEGGLKKGQAIGGAFVYVPKDPGYIQVYGYNLDLIGNLEQTGSGIDRSMFFTYETAIEIAEMSSIQALEELKIPADSVSAAMVKVQPGKDIHAVAAQIQQMMPDIATVESNNLFHSQRVQILRLLQSAAALLGVAWLLFIALIGLVFSLAINERRQEIGVLRALGLTQVYVAKSLLTEGMILALGGGVVGILTFTFAVYLFRNLIIQAMGVPFVIPSPLALVGLALAALLLALTSVALGAMIPTVHTSRMDPALAMRS
jgi:putative ABC transport system permease protein